MATVDEIRAALDEMDKLAAAHVALQNDPNAQVKDVRHAETLRDAQEIYVGDESRRAWLRTLLARIDALERVADAAREFAAHEDSMSDAFEVLSQTWHKAQLAETSVMRSQFEALQTALAALDASADG